MAIRMLSAALTSIVIIVVADVPVVPMVLVPPTIRMRNILLQTVTESTTVMISGGSSTDERSIVLYKVEITVHSTGVGQNDYQRCGNSIKIPARLILSNTVAFAVSETEPDTMFKTTKTTATTATAKATTSTTPPPTTTTTTTSN